MDTQQESNGQANGKKVASTASVPQDGKPKAKRTRKTANEKLQGLLADKRKEVARLETRAEALQAQLDVTSLALEYAKEDLAQYELAAKKPSAADNDE